MGSRVGAIFIDMAMNTAAFASDLGKSRAALNSWASSSNKTLAGVVNGYRGLSKEISSFTERTFTLRNAVMTLAGGGALGLLINRSLDAASAIVDTADNIGIATKTLQEYTYAGRLSGIATEQMQEALKKFATSLGQAHSETGKFYTYLVNSNPELLKQVQNAQSVDEALNATFNSMGKMASQTDRLALAQAAFSKTNLDMVNLVKDGTSKFEEMRRKANELGIVIRDDLLRNAEDAGDKVDTLAQVFRAQLTTAVAANAKEIGHFAEVLTAALPGMIEMATKALEIVGIFTNWETSLLQLKAAYIGLASGTAQRLIKMKDAVTFGLTSAKEDVKKLEAATDASLLKIQERIEAIKNASNKPPPNAGGETPAETAAKAKAQAEYAEQLRQQAVAAKAAASEFKKLKDAADRIKQDGQGPFQNYINDVAQLDKMLKANLLTWEEYSNAVRQAQEKNFHISDRVKKVLGETQDAQEKYNGQMKELNALRGIQGGLSEEQYQQAVARTNAELRKAQMEGTLFADIMDKAIDGNIKSWKDLARAVLEYGKSVLKSLAAGQGYNGKGGGLGSLFGGLAGMLGGFLGGNSPGQAFGFATQGGYGPFQTFHSGGMVGSAGGLSRRVNPMMFAGAPRFHGGGLVGGEVPIIAKKGERVLTEQQQKSMGGGSIVIEYLDARGADAGVEQRLRTMIMELNNSIETRSVRAVQSERARNPQLFSGAL